LGQGLFWCQVDIIDAANFLAGGKFDSGSPARPGRRGLPAACCVVCRELN